MQQSYRAIFRPASCGMLEESMPAMTRFEMQDPEGIPRRAFLLMPVAFAGWIALFRRPDRRLPDPTVGGTGPVVRLILFSANGKREAAAMIRKIGKPDAEWRRELSSDAYEVTRREGTEAPFSGRYWNVDLPGIYRCVCCGTALFRSKEKFDSGTGWPSFSAPIAEENIVTCVDNRLSSIRTAVACRKCDAHLGHVFEDGPAPSGLRYCMNSASLRLVKYA
jgi:peptide-methionine (R)-S-oxide reductase